VGEEVIVPESFEREQGCTEAEWLRWLPDAVHGHELARPAPDRAEVRVGAGRLRIDWKVLPPRRIAAIVLPRLHVGFAFGGVAEAERERFMKRFDLHLQRGGG